MDTKLFHYIPCFIYSFLYGNKMLTPIPQDTPVFSSLNSIGELDYLDIPHKPRCTFTMF